jgi:hypothetical protein
MYQKTQKPTAPSVAASSPLRSSPAMTAIHPHHKECWDYVGHCAIFGCHQSERALIPRENNALALSKVSRWLTLHKVQWYLLSATVSSLLLLYFLVVTIGSMHHLINFLGPSHPVLILLLHL